MTESQASCLCPLFSMPTSCLCPLFSMPTCYVLGEETTFPSALAFHIHLAPDTIIQLLLWILCLFFSCRFKDTPSIQLEYRTPLVEHSNLCSEILVKIVFIHKFLLNLVAQFTF
ncbi:hypothetical protein GLYMA_13G196150v4 [Glycine max]|nr:hypothetical protein GLYMA_13G196150v4 [Glycine max]KAH1102354.1 hypothetical protein GYH30_036750 [Glycine max]